MSQLSQGYYREGVALQCLGRHAEALAAFSSGLAQVDHNHDDYDSYDDDDDDDDDDHHHHGYNDSDDNDD